MKARLHLTIIAVIFVTLLEQSQVGTQLLTTVEVLKAFIGSDETCSTSSECQLCAIESSRVTSPPTAITVRSLLDCIRTCRSGNITKQCFGVNYRQPGRECELFQNPPSNYSSQYGCKYYTLVSLKA